MGMLYHRGAAAARAHWGDREGELLRHMPAIEPPGEHAQRHVSVLAELGALTASAGEPGKEADQGSK